MVCFAYVNILNFLCCITQGDLNSFENLFDIYLQLYLFRSANIIELLFFFSWIHFDFL